MQNKNDDLRSAPINDVMADIAVSLRGISTALYELLLVGKGVQTFREVPEAPEEPEAPAPVKPEPASAAEKKAKPDTAAAPEAEDGVRTHEDIRSLLRRCTARGLSDRGRAIIKGMGCSKVSDLTAEQIETAYAKLSGLLEEVSA